MSGNKDNYKSLNEFEFRDNSTTFYGVALERLKKTTYNLVSTLEFEF